MRLLEVELVDQANKIYDFYKDTWESRYKTKPITENPASDLTFCKDLVRQLGFDRTRKLVEHFFEVPNKYFQEICHSLDALRKYRNVVNASLGQRLQAQEDNEKLGHGRVQIRSEASTLLYYLQNSKMIRDAYKISKEKAQTLTEADVDALLRMKVSNALNTTATPVEQIVSIGKDLDEALEERRAIQEN